MVNKILFWAGFGIAVRAWQLGLQMRPILHVPKLWVYPVFATVGGGFGYWLQGVEQRQLRMLTQQREALLEKRRRIAEKHGALNAGNERQRLVDGVVATPDHNPAGSL